MNLGVLKHILVGLTLFYWQTKTSQILRKYGNKLFITKEEFNEYSKNKDQMNVIVFENFEKFNSPIKPKRFVTVAGKYIDENEFEMIRSNMG